MIRWLRSSAVAICATQHVLIVIILMFGLWAAAAELYSALIAGSHRGEFLALVLSIFTIPFSYWLFTNLLQLAHDLRELCVPQRRQLLAGALSFILGLMWVIPCALLAVGHWAARDLLLAAMGMPAGCCVALLWRVFGRHSPFRAGGFAGPRRALRILLGKPYAPVSWPMRLMQLILLCAVLAMPPVLVGVFGGALSRESFAALVHAAELLGFLAAVGLCWIWPLSRVVALFRPAHGSLSELALLPGMGEGRQRLQQLLTAAIGVPAVGLGTLLIVGLGVAWREDLPAAIYWKVLIEFLLILIITLPIVLGQIAHPRPRAIQPTFVMSQIWIFSLSLWMVPWDALRLFMALRWLAWLTIAVVLSGLVYVVGWAIRSLREISRRPHLFVEINELGPAAAHWSSAVAAHGGTSGGRHPPTS
jgi:hypothetical protein